MAKNKNFNFFTAPDIDIEMSFTEHLDELRQRIIISTVAFISSSFLSFIIVKPIIKALQTPAVGIKFLQMAPGEYFFTSVKVSFYCGLVLAIPFILYQIILFVFPGMTQEERKTILPLVCSSVVLFIIGLSFGYLILIPAALSFFINFGSDVVEPLWSLAQYFDFILLLLISTGLCFQLPIFQVILGVSGLISGAKMINAWKYVIVVSTILAAFLTPSTDPVTQLLMSSAFLLLYFFGAGLVLIFEKST